MAAPAERAADFAGVGSYLPEGRLTIEHNLNLFAHQAAKHPVKVRYDSIQVEHFRLQHLATAKRQKLLRERGRPLACISNLKHLL